ncbi:MAG: Asp-tRNA(Asn)/Glu-tRNA(Gln) amidotransferase GatCAB subunit C [Spiroplasma sp.]|nr:Asp-tRNA(Asn)/Glu-tRNA(Gln) amidotransferase GatCAB subunit C [Spiroplasma sp.]
MAKLKTKITTTDLQQFSEDLFFQLDDKQTKNLLSEFAIITKQMALVQRIDTENVLPLDFPFDITNHYLRVDEVSDTLDQKLVLTAAPKVKGDYILINRVVNDEN